jgi:hypothetical protein
MTQVLLHVDQHCEGIRLKVWGTLDVDTAADLETVLLLEASLQPPVAVLDLRDVDVIQPCVRNRTRGWVDAFREVGSQLAVLLP